MSIIDQMVSRYQVQTSAESVNALHEVMQQVTLSGLYRGGFFDKAAFYGGTCLRIFYKSPRFSEDMDFSLLKHDPGFHLEDYFEAIKAEFRASGKEIVITKKEKRNFGRVESAFLKENTTAFDLSFSTMKTIKIKIEVDTDPPVGFRTEHKLLLLPFSFYTRCYTISGLFSGKLHAFLFRSWKNRVKGRDWYDFEWFVRNNTVLDLNHFNQRAIQSGNVQTDLNKEDLQKLLKEKIQKTKIQMVKTDVTPFLKNPDETDIWSTEYFHQLVDLIRIE